MRALNRWCEQATGFPLWFVLACAAVTYFWIWWLA